MKTTLLYLALLITGSSFSQIIFSEDFSNLGGVLPAGWSVIDNDGLTPNASVSQFTSAWIIAADFDNTSDTVAMSTSWYTPAGTSDDWLITPAINLTTNNILAWEAEAQDPGYPDGYEVRISTTTPTIAGFNANPALFQIANENGGVWTQRSVDLQAAGYSNQTVYIAWRNISNDEFILMVDDISISAAATYDAVMSQSSMSEYTIIPLPQVTPLGTDGTITNNGSSPITNVTMTVNVYDGAMSNVYNATSTPLAALAAGANAPFTVAGYTPSAADIYTVELISGMTELDSDPSSDTVIYTMTISDSVYARDDGNVTGTLGIGAGNGGQLGQAFTLNNADDLTSVSIFIANTAGNMVGQPLSGGIYETDGTGTPTNLIASTTTMTMDTTSNTLWTLPISGGAYNLAAGEYVVVVNEVDSNVTVGTTNSIFTAGKTWVDWPTNPLSGWAHNEDFGFSVSYVIRPNFGEICTPIANTPTQSNDSLMTSVLGDAYQWIDCGTGMAIGSETNEWYLPTTSGSYAVIVYTGSCVDTSTCVAVTVTGISEQEMAEGLSIYPNPSDGNFTVHLQGISTNAQVAICDLNGKELEVANTKGNKDVQFEMESLKPGIYLVKVTTATSQYTERLVISTK